MSENETLKFRKKPVVIEAFRWTGGPDQTEAPVWIVGAIKREDVFFVNTGTPKVAMVIKTLEGNMIAKPGDWIIRGVKGEIYPCKPDIFAATYEPADSPSPDAARLADELRQAEAEIAELRENIVVREARRLEILEWWQTFTGTGWECENCRHSTYHAHANECAECGTPFPRDNLMAFKLGASGTEEREFLDRAARNLYGVSFAELRNNAPAIVKALREEGNG